MSDNYCPQCGEQLPRDAINLPQGIAQCSACGRLSRLSDVVDRTRSVDEILTDRPHGCAIQDRGLDVVVSASLRSPESFITALFVALFWNGIVSIFAVFALAGLYANLIGPPPAWFPAPEMNDQPMTLGTTLFLCMFLTPFVGIGSMMVGFVLMCGFGKVEVSISDDQAFADTRIGILRWRRRFDPNRVRRIRCETAKGNSSDNNVIVIEAERTVRFGSTIPDERFEWLHAALSVLLTNRDRAGRKELLAKVMRQSASF